eukprot:10435432-Heterocapsa_arctica.AAC.1
MENDCSMSRQSLTGSPFGPWEVFRRRPSNYAAWATIQIEKWLPPSLPHDCPLPADIAGVRAGLAPTSPPL